MALSTWLYNNYIEVFGAVAGVIYVFLEIRQTIWLWPVGILTSAVYIWVFLTSKFYADMSLQGYYLVISIIGWYWWVKGTGGDRARGNGGVGDRENQELRVTRLKPVTGLVLAGIFVLLFVMMWIVLSNFTDSPVPGWDSFITSLSIVATWMLARKIYEHWFLWIMVNAVSVFIFIIKGLYPTILLYIIYLIMSFMGLIEWRKTISPADIIPADNNKF